MSLRVVFFGSSQNVFSRRFYEVLAKTGCEIVAVVDVPEARRSSTNPARDHEQYPGYREEAASGGVSVFEPDNPNVPEFVTAIGELRPDLFFAVGYMFRLRAEVLAVPRIVSANVHASLLPFYRGRSPVFWALRHGEPSSGLTIHAMDDQLDTGEVLYQVRVRTRKNDTVASLYDRIISQGVNLVPRLIADAHRSRLPRKSQAEGSGSYFSAPTEDDFRLDWSRPTEELRRWIVITPGQCFTAVRDHRIHFCDAKIAANPEQAAPGTLLKIGSAYCTIATGDGALRIGTIRLCSGEQMPMPKFCRQANLSVGHSLMDSIFEEAAFTKD